MKIKENDANEIKINTNLRLYFYVFNKMYPVIYRIIINVIIN